MRAAVVALLVAAVASVATARAQPIVVEARVGDGDAAPDPALAQVIGALRARNYRSGDALAPDLQRLSRALEGDAMPVADLLARAAAGREAWHSGKLREAVRILGELWFDVRLDPRAVTHEPSARKAVFDALVTLAVARNRLSAEEQGATMEEILRTFPDETVTRAVLGPDGERLYQQVRERFKHLARGVLTVRVDDPAVDVWIDERHVGSGHVMRPDLLPGGYRVYLRRGRVDGRMYAVKVESGKQTTLDVDWALDAALHAGPGWVGFRFATAAERAANETEFAAKLARRLGVPSVVALSVEARDGHRLLLGKLIDSTGAQIIRAARVELDLPDAEGRAAALAAYLVGDPVGPGLVVALDPVTLQPVASPRSRSMRAWAVGGVAAGGLVAGGVLLYLDDRSTIDSRAVGTGVLIGGLAVAAASATLFYLDRRGTRTATVIPTAGGAVGVARWRF